VRDTVAQGIMLTKPGKRPLIPAHRALKASDLYLNPKAQCATPTYPCKRAPTDPQTHRYTLHLSSFLLRPSYSARVLYPIPNQLFGCIDIFIAFAAL
jgi:hypothetical protein